MSGSDIINKVIKDAYPVVDSYPISKLVSILGTVGGARNPKLWFVGAVCGYCGKTANVLAPGPGWFCTCGDFNPQNHNGYGAKLHRHPNVGPGAESVELMEVINSFPPLPTMLH